MKHIQLKAFLCLLISLFYTGLYAQIPCTGGSAAGYPCNEIDLMSFVSLSNMGCSRANDVWGWTDPQTGNEYAIFGCSDRTTFFDITNPVNPVFLGHLISHNNTTSTWRDMKVYANHAFIVSEAGGHGMQVFNLTQLRNVNNPPTTFSETAFLGNLGNGLTLGNAHNIVINEASGYAYTVGTNSVCAGGLAAIDISNPTNPTFAGCFEQDGYTHDAQCVNYIGPDTQYTGKEICFNSNENTLTIVDVDDKTDMTQISRTGYNGQRYTHQGWLTENHEYFLMNDELDESNNGHNTRTLIWDVRNLDAPVYLGYYQATVASIDHNLYTKGDKAYLANYTSGLRILDISDIANSNLNEIAYFDIYPSSDAASFNGAWSNYPYFPSGNIIISGIEQGLFVVRPTDASPTCNDGILNGDEIGVDCGGPDCPACPAEDCTTYNFSTNTIFSFDAAQDFGTAAVQDAGATLLVEGNVWKAVEVNYTLTPNTVIEFDFKSTAQGEIHEIAFDNDLVFAPTSRVVVYGDQGYAGDFTNPTYSGSGNFEHFTVNIGANFTGTYQYMVLTADDDADANANSYFRNIQIYEDYNGDLTCGSGPTCTDGLQNGNETGIDCGGSVCPPCSASITFDLCVFLEGPYNINNATMGNTLQSLDLLAAQPYNKPPWNYSGSEGIGWTAADYPTGSVDWVLVSFRAGIAANTEIAKTAAIVQQDGCLYFPNENVLSQNQTSPPYIVIQHRNHIAVMTPQPIQIINNTLTYDFRSADSYKDNSSFGQKQLSAGTWAMYAGDADQSEPLGYDINGQDKSIWANSNGIFDGYFIPDFNQDGDVNGADKGIWFSNNGISSVVPK